MFISSIDISIKRRNQDLFNQSWYICENFLMRLTTLYHYHHINQKVLGHTAF